MLVDEKACSPRDCGTLRGASQHVDLTSPSNFDHHGGLTLGEAQERGRDPQAAKASLDG
jgi:hypothetical protein